MNTRVEVDDVVPGTICAQHPGRETGVRCQRCLRPICPECMVPASVGFQCHACASAARAPLRLGAFRQATPFITYGLIGINVVVAVLGLATSSWAQGDLGTIGLRGGLLGGGLTVEGSSFQFIGISQGEWYRVVTGAFIHAGPLHLGFNMLALWQAGVLLEAAFGRLRFAVLYAVAVLGGAFGALLLQPGGITVGASGGVFGLMGALFMAERNGMLGPRRSGVGLFIVMNLALTFAVPGISIGGHIGGLVAGGAVGWMFQEYERRRLGPAAPFAVAAVLGTSLFAGCLWAASRWLNPVF